MSPFPSNWQKKGSKRTSSKKQMMKMKITTKLYLKQQKINFQAQKVRTWKFIYEILWSLILRVVYNKILNNLNRKVTDDDLKGHL